MIDSGCDRLDLACLPRLFKGPTCHLSSPVKFTVNSVLGERVCVCVCIYNTFLNSAFDSKNTSLDVYFSNVSGFKRISVLVCFSALACFETCLRVYYGH